MHCLNQPAMSGVRVGDPEVCRVARTWRELVVREELEGCDGSPHERAAGFLALLWGECLCEGGLDDLGFLLVWQSGEHAEKQFFCEFLCGREFEKTRRQVFVTGFERLEDEGIVPQKEGATEGGVDCEFWLFWCVGKSGSESGEDLFERDLAVVRQRDAPALQQRFGAPRGHDEGPRELLGLERAIERTCEPVLGWWVLGVGELATALVGLGEENVP